MQPILASDAATIFARSNTSVYLCIQTYTFYIIELPYPVFKTNDLIISTAFIGMKASGEFTDKSTAITQLGQTGFTYWRSLAGMVLSLDNPGWLTRYIVSRKPHTIMSTPSVTDTLEIAPRALLNRREGIKLETINQALAIAQICHKVSTARW